MLIVNADIAGRKCAVRFHETIEAVGQLQPSDGEAVYDAQGGRLLPGLHDHHIHLRAMAARRASLDLSKADIGAVQALAEEIDGTGWIRVLGYHNDRHGELNRDVLDELCPARPIRVQHSSGKMWVLNSQVRSLSLYLKEKAGRGGVGYKWVLIELNCKWLAVTVMKRVKPQTVWFISI